MEKLQIGDVVELKSGGPDMTVTQVSDGEMVNTTWFSGTKNDKNERGIFPAEALKLAEPGII